jgi:hypothetical protein
MTVFYAPDAMAGVGLVLHSGGPTSVFRLFAGRETLTAGDVFS